VNLWTRRTELSDHESFAESSHPLLETSNLSVSYGQVQVLSGIDLFVQAGEIVALLGANGSGKTTLLLTLSGHLKTSDGRIRLFGQECKSGASRRARQGLAFVGDDRHVFPSLTVRQNFHLVGQRRRQDASSQSFPELHKLLSTKAGLLSGGEQQMLALGRALDMGPRLLIVDELSLGLAPMVRDALLCRLRSFADDGMGILVVEQEASAILAVANRAYVLQRGRIADSRPATEWLGRSEELFNLFVS
jgi:branched-chain amino acid transport system ATP-binding protein